MKKGITAEIFRSDYECDLNKFNNKKHVTVICKDGVFEPSEDYPEVVIIKRNINYNKYPHVEEYWHAEPADKKPGEYFAFGGSFIHCSDSRFPSKYPIPLHDRRMNME